jgi:hypothetical protein
MFTPNVRRAIFDRTHTARPRGMKPGSVKVSVVVRLTVEAPRIRDIGGRERQINLTARERTCLEPVQVTLFGDKDRRRSVRLIVNRRRAYLLSVTSTGIVVFSYSQVW